MCRVKSILATQLKGKTSDESIYDEPLNPFLLNWTFEILVLVSSTNSVLVEIEYKIRCETS